MATVLLRLPAVLNRTGLSKSHLYLLIQKNQFPGPVKIGGVRSSAWIDEEIEAWVRRQVDASRTASAMRA